MDASSAGAPDRPPLTLKRFREGTHRVITPAETVARVRPLMPAMGITRIANVTGLDTIGVPVVMVCRPGGRSLSVSQGKGLDLDAARASGLMESVEHFHAEQIRLPLLLDTWNELRQERRTADVTALPRFSFGAFHGDLRLLWIEGIDLIARASTWVPYEVVHTDYTLPLPTGSGAFFMSSSGLASGNHVLEAISHGICELIERDATTLWRASTEPLRRRTRIDLATIDDPGCREVLDRFERASVDAFVWETTTDIGVPAFSATIVDRDPNPERPIGPMGGMGCHPSRGIALLRALTEAALSRLTIITGSRDDVSHSPTGTAGDLEAARRFQARMRGAPPERSFRDAPDHAGETFEDDLGWLLERLHASGLSQVVVVDLTRREIGIPVVRVVIPGLEPLDDVPGYTPGSRAKRRAAERDP
jgi:ribosomal protein S12 methylthiotransferase accessory factor